MRKTVILWMPAAILIAGFALLTGWSIYAHFTDDPAFSTSYTYVLVMLAPLIAFIVNRTIKIDRNADKIGGMFNILVSTASCAAIVILVNVIANITRMFAFNVEPWEIYAFYLAISIAEEVYYRIFIVLGIIMLLSSRNKAIGITGTIVISVLAIATSLAETVTKIPMIVVSIIIFIAFTLPVKRSNKKLAIIPSIVAVVVSGVTFSLAHFRVYAEYPEMLVATLIGGLVMATFLAVTRNPFVPITAHFLNNLAALRGIVIN